MSLVVMGTNCLRCSVPIQLLTPSPYLLFKGNNWLEKGRLVVTKKRRQCAKVESFACNKNELKRMNLLQP